MTDYSRGYAAGQIAMRERAAAECYSESVRWQNETGEPQPAQALCAARILSLPIQGEADQRGAAVGSAKPVSAGSNALQEASVSPTAQSAPHHNSSGPCVVVPVEPTEKMIDAMHKADRDFSNNCFHGQGHLSRAEFVYHAMLAAAKEEHDAHR